MLDGKYQATLGSIPDGPAKTGGVQVGEEAASAMLAARQNDGRNAPDLTYREVFEPGQFRAIPPSYVLDPHAWVKDVKPFALPGLAAFQVPAPNPLTSAAYAADFNEVKSLGSQSSTTRTPEQSAIAQFWDRMPLGDINAQMAQRQGLDASETARLYAMTSLASADGMIAQAANKYHWNNWRPVTAVREADNDGNPATTADPDWLPVEDQSGWGGAEYPAGHNTGAGMWTRVLEKFFGGDVIPGGELTVFNRASQTTRSFTRFSQMSQEVIDARVYQGVHFRSSSEMGAALGRRIADYTFANYFHECSRTITGTYVGSLLLTSGITCLAPGSTVTGSISIVDGAGLVATGATVKKSVGANRAGTLYLRKAKVGGSVSSGSATRQLVVTQSDVQGSVSLMGNSTGDAPITVSANTIRGSLSCYGNQPAPTNELSPNTVGGRESGQCQGL